MLGYILFASMSPTFLVAHTSALETNSPKGCSPLECLTGWPVLQGVLLVVDTHTAETLIQLLELCSVFPSFFFRVPCLTPSVAGQSLVKGTECKADYLGVSPSSFFVCLFGFL